MLGENAVLLRLPPHLLGDGQDEVFENFKGYRVKTGHVGFRNIVIGYQLLVITSHLKNKIDVHSPQTKRTIAQRILLTLKG